MPRFSGSLNDRQRERMVYRKLEILDRAPTEYSEQLLGGGAQRIWREARRDVVSGPALGQRAGSR